MKTAVYIKSYFIDILKILHKIASITYKINLFEHHSLIQTK